jgi:hypothetical protein
MDYFILVHVLQPNQDVAYEEFGLTLVKDPLIPQMVPEISSVEVVHD